MNTVHYSQTLVIYAYHDDVMIWKHFPHCWPFVQGIHLSTKGQWFGHFFILCFNKLLNKHLGLPGNWATMMLLLWHCYAGIILCMHQANERWCYNVTVSHWLGSHTELPLVMPCAAFNLCHFLVFGCLRITQLCECYFSKYMSILHCRTAVIKCLVCHIHIFLWQFLP